MRGERRGRLEWIDAAKGIGILLMIYGHVLQKGFRAPGAAVLDQLRIMHSFNMPMFFLASGFFYRARPAGEVLPRLRDLFRRRLTPVLFFSLLTVPVWLKVTPRSAFGWRPALDLLLAYLQGHPELNWVTWFLVCLLVMEIQAQLLLRFVRPSLLPFAGAACVLAFVTLAAFLKKVSPVWGDGAFRFWFVGEAGVALGFHAIGSFALPWLQRVGTSRLAGGGMFLTGLIVLLLLSRRPPEDPSFAVTLAIGQHGPPL